MKPNKLFNVSKSSDNLTLSIYGSIGADWNGDGITAQTVSDALKAECKSITVRVNSPGGSAFDGVAIYNLLKSSNKPVNVIVDGMAASAASIIAMAGDTITMATGSVMMIHEGQAMAFGAADDMRKMADTLDTVTGSIADIYVAKTGLKKADVLKMQNVETWMNADEAVAQGFATAVSKDKSAVKNEFKLDHFRNAPVELRNQAKTREVDGENLTYNDYVYAGNPDDPSTWSLPYKFSTEAKTQSHLRDALARFDQDEVIPASHKDEVWAKLLRLCKEYGIKVDSKGTPKNHIQLKGKKGKSKPAADEQDECQCDCEQCAGGDCSICSNDDCDDPICDCYNQDDPAVDNQAPAFDRLTLLQKQLELNKRK